MSKLVTILATLAILLGLTPAANAATDVQMVEITTAAMTCGDNPLLVVLHGVGHFRTQERQDGKVLISSFNWPGMKGIATDPITLETTEYNLVNIQRVGFVFDPNQITITEKIRIMLIGHGRASNSVFDLNATFILHADGSIEMDVKKMEFICR